MGYGEECGCVLKWVIKKCVHAIWSKTLWLTHCKRMHPVVKWAAFQADAMNALGESFLMDSRHSLEGTVARAEWMREEEDIQIFRALEPFERNVPFTVDEVESS